MHERNRNDRNERNERDYRDRDGNRKFNNHRRNDDREANGNRNVNDRSRTGYMNQSRTPQIEKWVTEKTVVKQYATDGRHPLRLNAIIERPKFATGEFGFYRLMTTITVGDYHVRLPIRALRTLMDWLENEKEAIIDGVQETYELNEDHNNQSQHGHHGRGYARGRDPRRSGPPRRTRGNYRDHNE